MAADDPLKERFEILRRRAQQAARGQTQQEREGLRRRFAQIGQVGSGAQIRAEAQLGRRAAERMQRAEEAVGLAELGERQRIRELGEAREFARGEREAAQRFGAEQARVGREAAQRFGAEQARVGREFARGERTGAQQFAAQQAEKGREFARQQQALQRELQDRTFSFQQRAFDAGVRQFEQTFARDTATIEFNKKMAQQAQNQSLAQDVGLGSLFGGRVGELLQTGQRIATVSNPIARGLESAGIPSGGFSVGGGGGGLFG